MATAALTILTDVEKRLSKIKTVGEAKDIRDQAEAVRVYAKAAGKGLRVQNQAAYIKIQAERRAGELLAKMKKAKGGRGKTASGPEVVIKELGHTQVHRWEVMSTVPNDVVQQVRAEADENQYELTSTSIYRLGRPPSRGELRKDRTKQRAGEITAAAIILATEVLELPRGVPVTIPDGVFTAAERVQALVGPSMVLMLGSACPK